MQKSQKKKKNQLKAYVKYSSLTIQIIIIVYVGAHLGRMIDLKLKTETNSFLIIFSLLSITGSLYYLFKKITKETNNE